ncbi:MAG: AIR synthase-related protein, partial [Gammaproteobacteria bacterium]|nr:AIR synthase-related protein [Gammaproteobacteria bacterium]
DVGRHGMAIMAVREGLEFESTIESDSGSVAATVLNLLEEGVRVHCLRDLTRGGLASALVEIAEAAHLPIEIEEGSVPVIEPVRGACEILGLDPHYVANEGRFIAFVPPGEADAALRIMRSHRHGGQASRIGEVGRSEPGIVTARSLLGTRRIIDRLSGEQLPRIC